MPSRPSSPDARAVALTVLLAASALAQDLAPSAPAAPISAATESCIFCHEQLNPGLVADWRNSRRAHDRAQRAADPDPPGRYRLGSLLRDRRDARALGTDGPFTDVKWTGRRSKAKLKDVKPLEGFGTGDRFTRWR